MRALLATALLLAAPAAFAQEDKAKCRASFEAAQTLRDEGKLSAAREEMTTCTRVCPNAFAKLCEGWLGDVEKSIPTIVLRAVDGSGRDLVDVSVTLDGKPIATRLDGKSIALDPGTHVVKLAFEGAVVTKEIVVAAGEKNRIVLATFASKPPPPQPVPAPVMERPSAPIAAFVVGGLGVVALGGFAYFGLKGDSDHHALVDSCSKTASCTQEDKDKVLREWRTADVFLASGVVLLGVGTYLYVTHDSGTTRTSVGLAPGRATFRLEF
jgi:hypothetical protein